MTNFLGTPYIFGIHNCIYINHIPVSHHVKLMCSVLVIARGCLGAQSVLSMGFNGSKQTTIEIALTLKLSKESPTGWKTRQEVSLLECFHFNAEIRIGIPEWLHLSLFLDSHSPSFVFVSGDTLLLTNTLVILNPSDMLMLHCK